MSWDELYSEDFDLDSKKQKLDSKTSAAVYKPRKLESKKQKLESKNGSSKSRKPPEKILDISSLWGQICDLRNDFGMDSLIQLLTAKSQKSLSKLNLDKVPIQRTKAATAIITLYRHLKKEGFI